MSEYKAEAEWEPDSASPYKRMARMSSPSDKLPEITIVTPPEFDKGIPNHWTPEHLFVSSLVACFFATFMRISEGSSLSLKALKVAGTSVLSQDKDGKNAITKVDLYPDIVVEKDKDIIKANRIAEKTEQECLIANSMKSEIMIHPSIRKA